MKSSNGTFINGERLSAEGVESEPYELKSDDIVVRSAQHMLFICSSPHTTRRNSGLISSARTTRPSSTIKLPPASSAYSQNKMYRLRPVPNSINPPVLSPSPAKLAPAALAILSTSPEPNPSRRLPSEDPHSSSRAWPEWAAWAAA